MPRHLNRGRRALAGLGALALLAASCGSDATQAEAADPEVTVAAEPPTASAAPTPTQPSTGEQPAPTAADVETSPPSDTLAPLPFHVEGHRGTRGLKPENTLQAFETALDIGVSTLELDLHLTADNWVVVWHDDNLPPEKCRFTDDTLEFPEEGVPIASLTVEQLAEYQCDQNPDPGKFPDQENGPTTLAGGEYQPVTLAAVFDFVEAYVDSPDKTDEQRGRAAVVEFNIETKRDIENPEGIGDGFDGVNAGQFELEVLAAVEEAGVADRVVIQSFDFRSLWAIRSINPDIRLSALTTFEAPDFAELAAQGANIWSPNFNAMPRELVDEAHANGLLVIPWTVNTAEDMADVLGRGADGLITDRPDIAAALQPR